MGIDRRHARALSSLLMSVLLTILISLSLTLIKRGLGPGFVGAWLSTAGIAFLIAFPVSYLAGPTIQRIVAWMTQPAGAQ